MGFNIWRWLVEAMLPFVDSFRTLGLAPTSAMKVVFDGFQQLAFSS
jgi:hypothetical protein